MPNRRTEKWLAGDRVIGDAQIFRHWYKCHVELPIVGDASCLPFSRKKICPRGNMKRPRNRGVMAALAEINRNIGLLR